MMAAQRAEIASLNIKRCALCLHLKHASQFGIRPWPKGCRMGLRSRCKSCESTTSAQWHRSNRNKDREAARRRRSTDRDRYNAYCREYYRSNPDVVRRITRKKYLKKRANSEGRLSDAIRNQINTALKEKKKGGRRTFSLLGYSVSQLATHLEKQFLDGMSWENRSEWHIDHIVPLASFSINGPDDPELKRAWAMTNLRPIWAEENLRKRDSRQFLL